MRMAVKKRQGVCRAMAYHLQNLTGESSLGEIHHSLRALSMLAAGKLNGYVSAGDSATSRASPRIWEDDYRAAFRDHRQDLVDALTEARRNWEPSVPKRISQSCVGCHQTFTKDSPALGGESAEFPRLGR